MENPKLAIAEFLTLAQTHPVFDVRSPGEFAHAHIPGAYSLPLFTDEERHQVGTLYKQRSREEAIKLGLDFFGPKMKKLVLEVEQIVGSIGATVLLHCWRGGMRSAAVSWLLELYGYKVHTLVGGYKAYRNKVLQGFDEPYQIKILGGYTGSGKTDVLGALEMAGETIIDLEKLAGHKGSAFGGIGLPLQPTQEMFENELYHELAHKGSKTFWLEDESQRIGRINIPHPFWNTMRQKPVYFLDIPFEERLVYILASYGTLNREGLAAAIERIQKRLGPEQAGQSLEALQAEDLQECFRILLQYYDKLYGKSLLKRNNAEAQVNKIPCSAVNSKTNAEKLMLCHTADTFS